MVPRDDDREFAEVVLAYLDARRERYNDWITRSDWYAYCEVLPDGSRFYISPSLTWKRRQPDAVAARIRAEAKRERKLAARRF